MAEILVPPMAVDLTISHLVDADWFADLRPQILPRRANPLPEVAVVVRRSGGTDGLKVTDSPFLTFQVFAPTQFDSERLAMRAYALVKGMEGRTINGTPCYRVVSLAGPADMYDAEADRERWVFSVQASFRVSAL